MNYQNILAFMAVVEHGNITSAAKALHYTPPGIAEALKQLEKDLGVQLVLRKRGARNVVITAAGRDFIPKAKKWVRLNQEIEQFVKDRKKKHLRIAAGSFAYNYVIPPITQRLMQEYPDIELQLYSKTTREIAAGIEPQEFDVAICYGVEFDPSVITQIPFYDEERVILCPANTILPDMPVRPADLPDGHRISYSKRQMTPPREYVNWQRENAVDRLKKRPKICVPNWLAIAGYLTEPEDWSIVPISIADIAMEQKTGELTIRRIEPPPPPRRCTLLVSHAYSDTASLQAFLQCCGEFADTQPHLKKALPSLELSQ